MAEVIFTLLMLVMLQAVLGFDNLLYISLESKKAPEKDRKQRQKSWYTNCHWITYCTAICVGFSNRIFSKSIFFFNR